MGADPAKVFIDWEVLSCAMWRSLLPFKQATMSAYGVKLQHIPEKSVVLKDACPM